MRFTMPFIFFTVFSGLAFANSPPKILYSGLNKSVLNELKDDFVRVSVIVTDPDGIDDLIGGVVVDQGATLGAFVSTAEEGSYSIDITWDDLQKAHGIFTDGSSRNLKLVFFDQSGNKTDKIISIKPICSNKNQTACGDGCIGQGARISTSHSELEKFIADMVKTLEGSKNDLHLRSEYFCSSGRFSAQVGSNYDGERNSCNEYCSSIKMKCIDSARTGALYAINPSYPKFNTGKCDAVPDFIWNCAHPPYTADCELRTTLCVCSN